MSIYGHFFDLFINSRRNNNESVLNEICFTTNQDPLRIDSYQPQTYKRSMMGVPGGAYIEIYDNPQYFKATKVLRLNVCYGWIITNHKGKDHKKVWSEVSSQDRKLINDMLSRIEDDGTSMYSKILKFYNLPEDWPKPDYSQMFSEPNERTKKILEDEAYKKLEVIRKEKEELAKKEELRQKYYGKYL